MSPAEVEFRRRVLAGAAGGLLHYTDWGRARLDTSLGRPAVTVTAGQMADWVPLLMHRAPGSRLYVLTPAGAAELERLDAEAARRRALV